MNLDSEENTSTVRIAAVLLEEEELTVTDLAEQADVYRSAAQETLDQLTEAGILEKEGAYPAKYEQKSSD
jgi:predicted transcriptional regulator